MRDFQFYVTDDRSRVRSLRFVQTKDIKSARNLAQRMLADNGHHRAVEVCDGDRELFTLEA